MPENGQEALNSLIPSSHQVLLLNSSSEEQVKLMKLFTYSQLAQNFSMRQSLRLQRGKIKRASKALRQFEKETRESVRQEVERAKRNALAFEEQTNLRLAHIEQNHQQQVNILNSHIQEEKKKLQETTNQLQVTEEKCSKQEKDIQYWHSCYMQKLQECQNIYNSLQNSGGGGDCTIL